MFFMSVYRTKLSKLKTNFFIYMAKQTNILKFSDYKGRLSPISYMYLYLELRVLVVLELELFSSSESDSTVLTESFLGWWCCFLIGPSWLSCFLIGPALVTWHLSSGESPLLPEPESGEQRCDFPGVEVSEVSLLVMMTLLSLLIIITVVIVKIQRFTWVIKQICFLCLVDLDHRLKLITLSDSSRRFIVQLRIMSNVHHCG